jgi:hypothetical protein
LTTEAAGHLVAAAVAELAAGVEHREDDLERRLVLLLHLRDRDATAIVDDGDRRVGMDRDHDVVAMARECLVDRVVDHFPHEVVQAAGAGGSDVHAGPLADRLQTLQDGDVLSVVTGGRGGLPSLVALRQMVPLSHTKPRRHDAVAAGRGNEPSSGHKNSRRTP